MSGTDLQLCALKYLDSKWARADLIGALRNPNDLSILWNTLIRDSELLATPITGVTNSCGNLCYASATGQYYCGVAKLSCSCCQGYCRPDSTCKCTSCSQVEVRENTSKKTVNHLINQSITTSDTMLDAWLWSSTPSVDEQLVCIKSLLVEQRDLALQAASHNLSAVHLRQLLYVYHRYFIALTRWKPPKQKNKINVDSNRVELRTIATPQKSVDNMMSNTDRATYGLAKVGTRAALNFSFAFLRRSWKSGEDTELCTELLLESLDAMQDLPEATLFDTSNISSLWLEALERSVKFLRQVVLGDVMGGRCPIPRTDRHIALSLLLELGSQKATLSASLDAVLLLLTLWEKEKELDDNREPSQNIEAPVIKILKRYEKISNFSTASISDGNGGSPTDSYLRLLTLPDHEETTLDLKQAAVVIVSHLDRLARPHLPTINYLLKENSVGQMSEVFSTGLLNLAPVYNGFNSEFSNRSSFGHISNEYSVFVPSLSNGATILQVVNSGTAILILSSDGEVFYMNCDNIEPECTLIAGMEGQKIIQIAGHREGKHFMALSSDFEVYSWGSGENGCLGHGDCLNKDAATKISALYKKNVIKICCGIFYSAAITASGELYTWGCGTYYGALGHTKKEDKYTPALVTALKGHKIIDAALAKADEHTLCVTNEGLVFGFGNGDCGRLGVGEETERFNMRPIQIESLAGIVKVAVGNSFSVALSSDGSVYQWGRMNDPETLGPVDYIPKIVTGLEGKIVIDITTGADFCLVLTSTGELYGWGRNDFHQVCPESISREIMITVPILATSPSIRVSGMTCGVAFSILWCHSSLLGVSTRIPYVVDLTESTFKMLDQLLSLVCPNQGSGEPRFPSSSESECIAVACLNLLRLQLHAVLVNNIQPKAIGIGEGTRLLNSLKTRLLSLAGDATILKSIQEAAQWTLQIGWSILLPTAAERAQTLTSLLPTEPSTSSSGHRFMTDLLVGSLMVDEGLETALHQAIYSDHENASDGHNLPLLHLIKQLLKNNSTLTQTRISQMITAPYSKSQDDLFTPEPPSPSLDLLHRFQRLLLAHIHQSVSDDVHGADALLIKYLENLISYCTITLTKAYEAVSQGYEMVIEFLLHDISDTLLNELLIGLVALHQKRKIPLIQFDWVKQFQPLLLILDKFNRLVIDSEIIDNDDMSWPGIISRFTYKVTPPVEDLPSYRQIDIENHNLDGGKWIVYNSYVCDMKDYECENVDINALITANIGLDLTYELKSIASRIILDEITALKVGKYSPKDSAEKQSIKLTISLTHLNSERILGLLLGMRAGLMQKGIELQPAESQCKMLLKSPILAGGLQVLQPNNPFDEEKGEARSSASTAGNTPTEPGNQLPLSETAQPTKWPHIVLAQRVESLLTGLGESRLTDPMVATWINISERFCKENNLIWHQDFPPDHSIAELERLLTAIFIRHLNLGVLVLAVIDRELSGINEKPPKLVADLVKTVHQTKWNLIKTRQQLNRSYKEVCTPMLDKSRFLLYEVRQAISNEQAGLQKLYILHKPSRFKALVHRIICEMRTIKSQMACAKPEDILNVTIQSQNTPKNQTELVMKISNENVTTDLTTIKVEEVTENNDAPIEDSKTVPIEASTDIGSGDCNLIMDKKNYDQIKPIENTSMRCNKEYDQYFINDVISKLSEKCSRAQSLNEIGNGLVNQIIDFVMKENCDVETLRRAMYCQVQRYQIRKQGVDMISTLFRLSDLLDSVQYNILSGYLGLFVEKAHSQYWCNILDDLQLITAFQKVDLILAHAKVLEWAIKELQMFVNQDQVYGRQRGHADKDSSNMGTYGFLKKLPRARFLLGVFGVLAKDLGSNELGLVINSGALGTILGLLRQTGGDGIAAKTFNDLSYLFEDSVIKQQKTNKSTLSGSELAKLMKIGTRIQRGADWKWGEQDGPPPGEGRIISEVGDDGWVRVEWDTGATNSYRMGKEGQYDLKLAESASYAATPETETDLNLSTIEQPLDGNSHPTKLLKNACLKMLKMLTISTGRHGDKLQKNAIMTVASMFRSFLSSKMPFIILSLEHWTTLGFLRAISSSQSVSKILTTPVWNRFLFEMLNTQNANESDVFKKVQCLRLLQNTLVNWTQEEANRITEVVDQLFVTLGKICLNCPGDLPLLQNAAFSKSRVLLSSSYSGTVAEEIIALLRKLHTLSLWNTIINSFISQKLCVAIDLYNDTDVNSKTSIERFYVAGALYTIGGYDKRLRIGLSLSHEGQKCSISGFTQKGKVVLSTQKSGELKNISTTIANECIEYGVFSLSKLPLNEMSLNSWAALLYGHNEKRNLVTGVIDGILLRSQQLDLAALNATSVLFRHQTSLRKILRQRTPNFIRSTSESSLSENEEDPGNEKPNCKNGIGSEEETKNGEILIQSLLSRATQPNPLKAVYAYSELQLAALSVSQMLAIQMASEQNGVLNGPVKSLPVPSQPTLIHGVPIYNDGASEDPPTPQLDSASVSAQKPKSKQHRPPCPLVARIMEIGFSRRSIEHAIRSLAMQTEVPPTADQIVQWILEHPDHTTDHSSEHTSSTSGIYTGTAGEDDSASDSESTDTGEVNGFSDQQITPYAAPSDFKSTDNYAMYVRGLVRPGMLVRCCKSFENIPKGDMGIVLRVDAEGLHDLNVQVDWEMLGSTYWVCYKHIELIEPPISDSSLSQKELDPSSIHVGTYVRVKSNLNTPRSSGRSTASSATTSCSTTTILKESIGVVTAVNGKSITVDFPNQQNWIGNISDIELAFPIQSQSQSQTSMVTVPSNTELVEYEEELIDDWSRCIRSLTVSSNERYAKYLLERSFNFWYSNNHGHSKHWIRLEINKNILIHKLILNVSPSDGSYMPSLISIKVGDSIETLKDFSWVQVKINESNVTLLSNMKQYYKWIEIIIKQCRNNGIQCKIHGINIVGKKMPTDIDMLLSGASFLATEFDELYEPGTSANSNPPEDATEINACKVLVWGLNDKEQLGGLKGSKIKIPTISSILSQLRPIYIAGGSKSLFIVSQDGKVYACGEGTNGRLGLGNHYNVASPRQLPILSQYVVKKVAVHSGGKHALALTLDGKVFSWGEGEEGKLGHGNRTSLDKPKLIESLRSKRIRDIACGSSHSAAITSGGELYTWGMGEYGRLGHGDNLSQLKPKVVSALQGHRVIQVACGSRDAQTLALTEEGLVFSWGDGDFGKLGRGGSEGCAIPYQIDRLKDVGVIQIECGAQFSLALTKSGEVWTWGKGDYYRLGHGSDQHVRKPTPIQGLRGKKVIHVAVGALHCLAVTETGQVFAWGDNDHGQQGTGSTVVNKKPCAVLGLENVFVNRVACGSSHSIAWNLPQNPTEEDKKEPVPFQTTKDPLGSNSLGIYDPDQKTTRTAEVTTKQTTRQSLTEMIMGLNTAAARQTTLNYVLDAMKILQARQCIVAALASHSEMNRHTSRNLEQNSLIDLEQIQNLQVVNTPANTTEVIANGGGEGPADAENFDSNLEATPDSEMGPVAPPVAGPISAFQSLTGSMSMSASYSSCNATQKHSKMSASAMSVMAATMTHQEEVVNEVNMSGLDEFTSLLGEGEAKSLIELLKLSVAGRTGPLNTVQTIANTLISLGLNNQTIGNMLLETCVTELEDLCTSRHFVGKVPKPVVRETSHPYVDDIEITGTVKIPGAEALRIEFDGQCSTEKRNDPLLIMDGNGTVITTRSGREYAQWVQEIRIPGDEMRYKFTSDSSVNGWGWRFWVHAIMPQHFLQEIGSDRAILSQPSMELVMALLDSRLEPHSSHILIRLAAALSACAQLSSLTTTQRIWALKKLHLLPNSKKAPKPLELNLTSIVIPLLPGLLKQYEYEEPQVRNGVQLMHSEYFKTLAALACDMQLDFLLPPAEMHKWAWFRRYCVAVRVAQSLIHRSPLPKQFCLEVRKKLLEMMPNQNTNVMNTSHSNSLTASVSNANVQYTESTLSVSTISDSCDSKGSEKYQLHENHQTFKNQHDRQLLQWLNRRPEDWALSWGGASTIYGWGHNHRGQLGGLEGGRIKTPTPCEALSLLRPVQLAGGEQTVYAVTPDGKLFSTGYGAGGRLGIGGVESVTTPTLVESLQHVFIKKVAVNSGGKHCLALTADGEVYSWGEGEDGKLGHGNRVSYDRPKLIEALSGIGVVDIACGSAHSACITSTGHVLTWGKGRYGRLGHGDSDDQLRPKLVETLLGYRSIDIACGSGDAQTLCITDDDSVWSWGDGDYGKLGRGGSDGCKVPMKIECLAGLGVIKVECGSQFSVALTRSGSVYTWGKGDYHRLGHGSADHVRRPKKIAALQGKKIVSIATGSLHCVACSDTGEVFTWGDNDEGQLGDGTVSAIQRPRLVLALEGKHIVKVTCGSAHTLALSTIQMTEGARPPPNPPLEYDFVRELPPEALHARLVLLHHFSELLCPCAPMLPIIGEISLSALKDVLVYSIKEASFRKVIQATMVRDKQHGPVIELNRIQVKRSRSRSSGGLAGVDGMKSVFGQMVQKLPLLTQEVLYLPHRVWKVKFVGESVDDCGGGFSESIAEMCDELQNGSVPLLIQTPNGRGEAGANRDCFLLDPTLSSVLQMNMFRFLGVLMGIAVRTGSPLSLNLAEPVWRQLTGETLRPTDLTEVDRDYVASLLFIRDLEDDPKVFQSLELPFSTPSAKGHEVPLSTRYSRITNENKFEYVKLALNYRLHEFDEQVNAVRDGMSKVIPVPLLSLFSASQLQAMVCGSPEIPLSLLKSVATYKGVEPTAPLVQWFWEVMEEFSNQERSLFLRFVWGRTRLPRTIADFRGRDFVLQVLDKYNPADHFLPESYTCFFLLKMPRYSCKLVLLEKLKYAIHFCKSIDTDEYARVNMVEPTEATVSDNNSDLDSDVSEEM